MKPEVESFVGTRVGTGEVGINTRIEVTYEPGTNDDVSRVAPPSFAAKMVSPDPDSRAAGVSSRIYLKEERFYREMAPRLHEAGMKIPKCWAAEFDAEKQATGCFSKTWDRLRQETS
jgi:hypothetical protein